VSVARFTLLLSSVAALAFTLRSVVVGPIPLELAAVLLVAYAGMVIIGVLVPRLEMFGPVIWRGPTDGGRIALTFDDGPDPVTTPLVLDELARARVRATFFVIGEKAKRYPEVVQKIVAAGHELGVHGYRHHRLYAFLTPKRVEEDVKQAQRVVEEAAGIRPQWFRPPVGQASPRTFSGARRAGVTIVGWTIRGLDGLGSATGSEVQRRVARGLAPGAIVVLHDAAEHGGRAPASVAVLALILEAVARAKLSPVKLSELLSGPIEEEPES